MVLELWQQQVTLHLVTLVVVLVDTSTVDRVDYSNDTAASVRGPLSRVRHDNGTAVQSICQSLKGPILEYQYCLVISVLLAQSTPAFAYFGGGTNPALNPTIIIGRPC